jgi:hypothetical protein
MDLCFGKVRKHWALLGKMLATTADAGKGFGGNLPGAGIAVVTRLLPHSSFEKGTARASPLEGRAANVSSFEMG